MNENNNSVQEFQHTGDNTGPLRPQSQRRKAVVGMIIGLLIIGMCVFAVSQYVRATASEKKLADANGDKLRLANQLKSANEVTSDVDAKYKALQERVSINGSVVTLVPSQDSLGVKIASVQYVNPSGTVTQSGNWLGVRLTLTNTTSQTVQFEVSQILLQDANANTYKTYGYTGATTLPEGWGDATLTDQQINAGQSVTGNVIFQVPDKKQTVFSFLNVTKLYSIEVDN